MPFTDPSSAAPPISHNSGFASSPWWDHPTLAARVERVFAEEKVSFGTDAIYTPFVVLGAWLWQALHHESCRAAVLWLRLHLAELQNAKQVDTGNYCRARRKLPEAVLRRLVAETAREAESAAAEPWRWHDREVFLVDGTTVSMPDTPANQAEYPQPRSQKPGVGFPLMRLVMIFSLATAMIRDAAFGPYAGKETGEPSLFRALLGSIPAGSVVVADRYYCSYWLVALAIAQGGDVVFRLHPKRREDFRHGKRLGPNDRQVVWNRPARPEWMSPEQYQQIPETLTLRMVRTVVTQPGFRVRQLTVLTTLDAHTYSVADIVSLYHRRWQAELDIRAIKSTMHMEVLTCKTPDNVRREAWLHLLAYNLCREQAVRAARQAGGLPRAISLAACLQAMKLHSSQPPCFLASRLERGPETLAGLTGPLAGERVGDRPNRCEPRAVKRRPKPQAYLNQPRALARASILKRRAA